MRANNQSIGPQVVAVWCEELGHDVSMVYHNGPEQYHGAVPDDADIVFINAFSQNAMLACALSNYYRSKGAVTALGGPHSRSYPDDTIKYFDYAIGFCDKELLRWWPEAKTPMSWSEPLLANSSPSCGPSPVRSRWSSPPSTRRPDLGG